METNDSNIKPQTTGGLKLMTVFIAVLALHVLVIGGFTVWHLLNPSNSDDMALDKSHKGGRTLTDGALPADAPQTDTNASDKVAATAVVPAPETTETITAAPADTASTAPAVAPAAPTTPATSAPTSAAPPPTMVEAESAPAPGTPDAQTPSGPIPSGPVVNAPQNVPSSTAVSTTATTAPAAPAAESEASEAPSGGTPYTVKAGDSLARIAHRHHVALAKLRAANSLTSDRLQIGQKLMIPARAPKMIGAAMPANSTPTPVSAPPDSAGHVAKTAANGHHIYTVMKGDTIRKIAHRFKTTTRAIMEANNLNPSMILIVGEKLRIPTHEPHSAAASSPAAAPAEPAPKSSGKGQLATYAQ